VRRGCPAAAGVYEEQIFLIFTTGNAHLPDAAGVGPLAAHAVGWRLLALTNL